MKSILIPFLTLGLLAMCGCAKKLDDEAAIKRVLEKESATWRAGDVKGHAACWAIRPYSRILVSTADGHLFDVPPANMLNPPPGQMGKGGVSGNSNYLISIHDNSAWVSHDEESRAVHGERTYSREIRMLEKIEGDWKIVGQSIHLYKPTDAAVTNLRDSIVRDPKPR